jgi:hypothetical protein
MRYRRIVLARLALLAPGVDDVHYGTGEPSRRGGPDPLPVLAFVEDAVPRAWIAGATSEARS